jgi:hypothetical protein
MNPARVDGLLDTQPAAADWDYAPDRPRKKLAMMDRDGLVRLNNPANISARRSGHG